MTHSVSPIGYIRSCFMEKFAIPRQPLLAPAARGTLELLPPFDQVEALEGLEQVSHVWLLFLFHQALEDKPRLKVRPPRLGGNRSLGVFATRATHRPNGIGQSVVRLEGFEAGACGYPESTCSTAPRYSISSPTYPTPTPWPTPATASPTRRRRASPWSGASRRGARPMSTASGCGSR